MKLYLDDDIAKGALITRLKRAGSSVTAPRDVGLAGASDAAHLLFAVQNGLCLMSKNHDDFKDLHLLVQGTKGRHSGILIVRADNDPTRDMKDADIARAFRKLENAAAPLANEFHILNHWR